MIQSITHSPKFHKGVLIFVGCFYVLAGIPHFTSPEFYLPMMPPLLPAHLELVYVSGFFEILGGMGLLIPKLRRYAAWGLVTLLLAVFPANIYSAIYGIQLGADPVDPMVMWIRLPFQILFIYIVWWVGLKRQPWEKL